MPQHQLGQPLAIDQLDPQVHLARFVDGLTGEGRRCQEYPAITLRRQQGTGERLQSGATDRPIGRILLGLRTNPGMTPADPG